MDNGTSLWGHLVRDFCKKFKIEQKNSTPYYPQGNGKVEATNKTIANILSKIVQKHGRDWHE